MSFGRTGLRRRKRTPAVVELTPLIDITFQLLIFFLLTATFQNHPSFKVKLPKAKNADVDQATQSMVVVIGEDGRFEVDRKPLDLRELEMRVCGAAKAGKIAGVNIKADAGTDHGHVVTVMDVAKGCGLEMLGILHAH